MVLKDRPLEKHVLLTEAHFALVCLFQSNICKSTKSKQLFTAVLMEYIWSKGISEPQSKVIAHDIGVLCAFFWKEISNWASSVLVVKICNAGDEKKMASTVWTRRIILALLGKGVCDESHLGEKVKKPWFGKHFAFSLGAVLEKKGLY